jgi:hypothetical protein
MPGWIPRWHPFVWAFVIIMIYMIWTDPATWGHKAAGLLHLIPEAANRVGIFAQNL